MKKQNKILTLDVKKWRYGGDASDALGRGGTCLLNYEGYMCCLGQFTPQLLKKKGIKFNPKNMLDKFEPDDLSIKVPLLNKKRGKRFQYTILTRKAIDINDAEITTPKEKIEKLRKLFKKHGYTIRLKNKHLL